MGYSQRYGKAIWTHHALDRLGQRGLTQKLAYEAFSSPDGVQKDEDGKLRYTKKVSNSTVTVIAKQNERKEWIILSCWIDPPLPGTEDERKLHSYRRYQQASGMKKMFLAILRQLGILS